MRSYTTHGTGRTTKVLFVPTYGPARTVTSAPAENAKKIASLLGRTRTQMPAALYDPAIKLDGAPFEARRHLLGVYDSVAAGRGWTVVDFTWEAAEALAADLAQAVQGLPAPVVAAVRSELGEHLAGMDGVLVPARANNAYGRRSYLNLVVSAPMHSDQLWTELAGQYGDLGVRPDDEHLPLGGPLAVSTEWFALVSELHDAEPTQDAPYDCSDIAELRRMAGEDDDIDLNIRVDHLLAFVAHHYPALLEQVEAKLSS